LQRAPRSEAQLLRRERVAAAAALVSKSSIHDEDTDVACRRLQPQAVVHCANDARKL